MIRLSGSKGSGDEASVSKPTFSLHRHRKTFCLVLNEPMAVELHTLLTSQGKAMLRAGQPLPPWFGDFLAEYENLGGWKPGQSPGGATPGDRS